MASKKVKLIQNVAVADKGTRVLDLGEMDDLFAPAPKPKSKGAVKDFYSGFKEGVLGPDKGKSRLKTIMGSFARNMLPDSVNRGIGTLEAGKTLFTDIIRETERKNAGALSDIAREAQQLLPHLQGKLSSSMFGRLEGHLSNKVNQYKYDADSAANQSPLRQRMLAKRQQSAMDEESIKEATDHNSLLMQQTHIDSEENAERRFLTEQTERGIRDKVSNKRYDYMSRALSITADAAVRTANYNEQVGYQVARRSLELQFRTAFGIRDLVKVSEAMLQMHEKGYTALVRNTGTPEHMKASMKELVKFDLANQTARGASNLVRGTLQNFLGSYAEKTRDKVMSGLGNHIQKLGMLASAGSMAPEDLWERRYEHAGKFGAGYASNYIRDKIAPRVAQKFRPYVDRAFDKTGGKQHKLAYLLDNAPGLAQEFMNDPSKSYGWRGMLQKGMNAALPQFRLDSSTQASKYQTIEQGAQFNQMTQRIIVDAIPGLLSRILQETTNIRRGVSDVSDSAMIRYDITNGKFVEDEQAQKNLGRMVIGNNAKRNVGQTLDYSLSVIDPDSKLSPEARKALSARMLRDSSMGIPFNPSKYMGSASFSDTTDMGVQSELSNHFKSKFSRDADGKVEDNLENNKQLQKFSKAFLSIRDIVRDPYAEVTRLISSGHTEPLRMLGILITEYGEDRINYERLWELMREDVSPTNPWGNSDALGEPTPDNNPGSPSRTGMNKEQLKAHFKRTVDRVKSGYNSAKGKAGDAFSDARSKINTFDRDAFVNNAEDLRDRASKALAPARDLVQAGTDRLLVRAADILNGDLMDINSGKIITDVKDITGEVINKAGDVIVTAVEAATGLADKNGIVVFKSTTELTGEFFANPNQVAGELASNAQEKVGETIDAIFGIDWYIPGKDQPLLLGRDIRSGEYIDQATQKVIQTADDITGNIVDRAGEVVATAEDLAKGLYNPKRNKVLKLKGLAGFLKNIFFGKGTLQSRVIGMAKHFLPKLAMGAWGLTKKITDRFIGNQDAYIPDTSEPIVTGSGLRRGEYFNDKGEVITNFKDHNGAVYDAKGQIVVSEEQRKDLLNVDGSKHDLSKKRGIFSRAIRASGRGYLKLTKKYYGWLGKKLSGGISSTISKGIGGLIDYGKLETPTDQLLGGILQTLQERLPSSKKEPRKGSWQEKYAKAGVEEPPEVDENGKPVGKGKGLLGKGLAGLAGLLGKGKKDKEESKDKSEEEEGGGIGLDDIADAAIVKDAVLGGKKPVTRKVGKMKKIGSALWKGTKAVASLGTIAGLTSAGAGIASAATAVGSGAMAVGGAIATGAAALLSGLLAVVTSPVTLVAAGVAALGYGAYKLHGWFTTRGEIRNLRLMQYGASSTSERKRTVELENYLETKADKGSGYTFKMSREELMEMAKIMDIKVDSNFWGGPDKASIMAFASWFDKRFKPVFVSAKKGLDAINKSDVALADIDSKVPDELKYSYLQAIQMPYDGNSPYLTMTNGFGSPDDPITISPDEIRAEFDSLLATYKDKAGADPDKKVDGEESKDGKAADAKDKLTDPSKDGKVAATGAAAAGALTAAASDVTGDYAGKGDISDNKNFASPVMTKVMRAGALASIGTVVAEPFQSTKLTGLQSLRFRAYGLETADAANCAALLSMESFYYNNSKVDPDGTVNFTGSMSETIRVGASLFGFPLTENERRDKFAIWFKERFEPVFKVYMSSIKKLKGQVDLTRIETTLSNTEKVQVGSSILGATNDKGDIWKSESIFVVRGSLDGLQVLATGELEYMKKEAEKDILETPTMSAGEQANAKTQSEGGTFSSFADSVKSSVKAAATSVVNTVSNAAQTVGDTWTSTGASIASYLGGNSGTLEARGTKFAGLEKASGGKWSEIPSPSQNKSKQAAQPMLEAISKMTGVPVELLNIFISLESSYDANAFAGKTNPKATATGLMQFINGTWDGMMKKYWKEYGLPDPSTDPDRAMRYDPRINALMGALYIRDNYSILLKGLGRDPSDVDMYMAHFLGPGTAIKFLKADPNIIGEKMFPEQARHNPGIFRQKSGQPRTLGEIYALMDKKIAPHRSGGGDVSLAKPGGDEVQTTSVEADVKSDTVDADAKPKDGDTSTQPTPVNSLVPSPGPGTTGSTPTNSTDPSSMSLGAGQAPPPPDFVSENSPDASTTNFPMQNSQSQKQAAAQERIRRQQLDASAETDSKMMDISEKQLQSLLRIEELLKGAGGSNPMNPTSNGQSGRSASTAAPPVSFN